MGSDSGALRPQEICHDRPLFHDTRQPIAAVMALAAETLADRACQTRHATISGRPPNRPNGWRI